MPRLHRYGDRRPGISRGGDLVGRVQQVGRMVVVDDEQVADGAEVADHAPDGQDERSAQPHSRASPRRLPVQPQVHGMASGNRRSEPERTGANRSEPERTGARKRARQFPCTVATVRPGASWRYGWQHRAAAAVPGDWPPGPAGLCGHRCRRHARSCLAYAPVHCAASAAASRKITSQAARPSRGDRLRRRLTTVISFWDQETPPLP